MDIIGKKYICINNNFVHNCYFNVGIQYLNIFIKIWIGYIHVLIN
jgi:cytosine/uracil/thiamine/allantoin permease